jgi:hypothetical protein
MPARMPVEVRSERRPGSAEVTRGLRPKIKPRRPPLPRSAPGPESEARHPEVNGRRNPITIRSARQRRPTDVGRAAIRESRVKTSGELILCNGELRARRLSAHSGRTKRSLEPTYWIVSNPGKAVSGSCNARSTAPLPNLPRPNSASNLRPTVPPEANGFGSGRVDRRVFRAGNDLVPFDRGTSRWPGTIRPRRTGEG